MPSKPRKAREHSLDAVLENWEMLYKWEASLATPGCPSGRLWSHVSQARVDQAGVRGEGSVLCGLALCHRDLELALGAIIEVGPSCGIDGRLGTREDELTLRNASAAHPCPDLRPGIVTGIAIEIPAVPILARLGAHGEPHIHVLPLFGLAPPVDFQGHAEGQLNVDDMERLAHP